jgi:hypothetical protein
VHPVGDDIRTRVVWMPPTEQFDRKPPTSRDHVPLPQVTVGVVIEQGSVFGVGQ